MFSLDVGAGSILDVPLSLRAALGHDLLRGFGQDLLGSGLSIRAQLGVQGKSMGTDRDALRLVGSALLRCSLVGLVSSGQPSSQGLSRS